MRHIKHIAIALLLAFTSQAVSAQIHESKSYIRKTTITKETTVDTNPWKKCQWFGRAGVLIPVAVSEHNDIISPMAGFDLDFGFKLRMGRHGWYWGMDLAMFTGGAKGQKYYGYSLAGTLEQRDGKTASKVGGRLGFTTFGWRAKFSDLILDINAGLAVSYTSEAKFDLDSYKALREFDDARARLEIPIGIGFAYKRFTLDFALLYSPVVEYDYSYNYRDKNVNQYVSGYDELRYNNFRISIGYLF